jgi:hypothetical protein
LQFEKPFTLIIDELNKFGVPLTDSASAMLKRLFLYPRNRYLVYSTHVPLDLDPQSTLSGSNVDYITVPFFPPLVCRNLEVCLELVRL